MTVEHDKADRIDMCLDIALGAGLNLLRLERRGKSFEFGDNPECVREQIGLARQLLGRLGPIVESIDLKTWTLAAANKYFRLHQELVELLRWLEEAEDEDFGGTEKTRDLKKRFGEVVKANGGVWQLENYDNAAGRG